MGRIVACLLASFVGLTAVSLAAQSAPAPRRMLIVVDELSLQFRSTPRMRDLISRTLAAAKARGDLATIVGTGRSGVDVPLSPIGSAHDSAVRRLVGQALPPRDIALTTAGSEEGAELRQRSGSAFSKATSALRSLSREAGALMVVYFTEGYPAFAKEPGEFAQEAARLNATVHVIDPRGFSDADRQFDAKDWESYLAATQDSVRTLAGGGSVISRPEEFKGSALDHSAEPTSR